MATSIANYLRSSVLGKRSKLICKGIKVAAAEAAATAAEAIAAVDLEGMKPLAAEFEALGGGALTMALGKTAASGDSLRECRLARERLRVSEDRSIGRVKILLARTDAAAEAAEAVAAEAAAAEVSVEEAAAAAGATAKAAADAPGARAALAPVLPKEPCGGANGMAEDAEKVPGRPLFSVGGPCRVLAATATGFLPRIATGCGEAIVKAYNTPRATTRPKPWPCTRACRPKPPKAQ
jgi:hypothetical protein